MPNRTSPAPTTTQASASQMQAAANQAQGELRAMAAFLGVDYAVLLKCLLRTIGFLAVLKALRTGDVWSAVSAVDWEKVIDCVSAQLGGGGFAADGGEAGDGEFTA
jgi:hypothetical protein